MTQHVETPPPGSGRGVSGLSFPGGTDNPVNRPADQKAQAAQAPLAVTVARDMHLAEIGFLCSELIQHAEVGCRYAGIGDERGLRYAVNCIVDIAIRAGDEALLLRQKSAEARTLEAERLSQVPQRGGTL